MDTSSPCPFLLFPFSLSLKAGAEKVFDTSQDEENYLKGSQ